MPATKLKERASPPAFGGTAYDADFYTWTIEQADALRDGRLSELDAKNLAEEIEDLGRETFKELESAVRVLLVHMLKWDNQSERRSRSWANSIATQRLSLRDVLQDNPGLRSRQTVALDRAFAKARLRASSEMKRNVSALPSTCPYTWDEILNRPFDWPES